MASTDNDIKATEASIVADFQFLEDWTERYQYLIDLGKKLPGVGSPYRTEDYKVKGCQSQVWLHSDLDDGRLYFQAESDSAIVSGLLALLLKVYSGRKPEEIQAFEPEFIDAVGLSKHLSPTRKNGLQAVLKTIYQEAEGARRH